MQHVTTSDYCNRDFAGVLTIVGPPKVSNPLVPPAVCLDSTTTVQILGSEFFGFNGDVPRVFVDGTDEIPTGSIALDGTCSADVSGYSTGVPGETTCDAITLTALGQEVDSGGGLYTLTVQNPEPADCLSKTSGQVYVIESPEVTSVTPSVVCLDGSARQLEVVGDFFRFDSDNSGSAENSELFLGDSVALTLNHGSYTCNGLTPPLSSNNPEYCTGATVSVTSSTYSRPAVQYATPIRIQPPGDPGCATTFSDLLITLAPPAITDVSSAPLICTGVETSVVLTGERFVRDGTAVPTLSVERVSGGGLVTVPLTADALSDCTVLSGTVELCTTITVDLVLDTSVDFYVTNPAPVGCISTVHTSSFNVLDPPGVTDLEAPITSRLSCSNDNIRVTGIFYTIEVDGDTSQPVITLDGIAASSVSLEDGTGLPPVSAGGSTYTVTRYTTAELGVPAALTSGRVHARPTFAVSTPGLGCSGSSEDVVVIVPSLSVQPRLGICELIGEPDREQDVSFVGAGGTAPYFLRRGGSTLPSVGLVPVSGTTTPTIEGIAVTSCTALEPTLLTGGAATD